MSFKKGPVTVNFVKSLSQLRDFVAPGRFFKDTTKLPDMRVSAKTTFVGATAPSVALLPEGVGMVAHGTLRGTQPSGADRNCN